MMHILVFKNRNKKILFLNWMSFEYNTKLSTTSTSWVQTCVPAGAALLFSASTSSASPLLTLKNVLLSPPCCLPHWGPDQLIHWLLHPLLMQGSPVKGHALWPDERAQKKKYWDWLLHSGNQENYMNMINIKQGARKEWELLEKSGEWCVIKIRFGGIK